MWISMKNRKRNMGGLAMHHVKYKARAILIRSFLESAVNPRYSANLYHNVLYRYHVIDDKSLKDPGQSPYYSKEFFKAIRRVVKEGLMNVAIMSTKEWYRVLMENDYTMELDAAGSRTWKLLKCELRLPALSWDRNWKYINLRGLNSDITSFLFKLLHDILLTASRQFRLNQRQSAICSFCEATGVYTCRYPNFLP